MPTHHKESTNKDKYEKCAVGIGKEIMNLLGNTLGTTQLVIGRINPGSCVLKPIGIEVYIPSMTSFLMLAS